MNADKPQQRIRHRATAGAELSGVRLDQAAAALFRDYSRSRLQRWIRSGELTVDGRPARPTSRLMSGEVLSIDAEPEPADVPLAQNIPLNILHADDDLIVIDKPPGLVVHPAPGNRDGTLQNALLHFDPALEALPRSGIVHRLDKDTSGVMVVARSLRAHTSLVKQLHARSMHRTYEAICCGEVKRAGTIDRPIGRHPGDRKRMAVVAKGRTAVTHYRALARFTGFTHLEVSIETGRTHQIRVHLAHLGFPVVGDAQYGRKPRSARGVPPEAIAAVQAFPRQALHARMLTLLHPADSRECRFEASLPADFAALLAVLQATLQ